MDLGKLMSMWEENKKEVDDSFEKKKYSNYHDALHKDEKDDREGEIRYLKEKLEQSRYREEDLEDEVSALHYEKEKVDIAKQKIAKELSDSKKSLEQSNEIEKENAKKMEIMDNLINKLKKDNDILGKRLNETKDVVDHKETEIEILKEGIETKNVDSCHDHCAPNSELNHLLGEIGNLKDENDEKQTLLVTIMEEKEIAIQKLTELEQEIQNLKSIKINQNTKSIQEELSIAQEMMALNRFLCEFCDKTFANTQDVTDHKQDYHEKLILEQHAKELEDTNLKLKIGIKQKILDIKVNEKQEGYWCMCRGFCRIFHHKHNFKRMPSAELLDIFNGITGVNSGAKLYSCKACGQTFQNVQSLRVHMKNHHRGAKPKAYNCEYCSTVFTRLTDLNEHIKSHSIKHETSDVNEGEEYVRTLLFDETEEEPCTTFHLCNMCPLSFKTGEDMREHIQKNHTNFQKYEIPQVKENVIQNISLENTSKEVSFPRNLCNICMLSFPFEEDLKEHILIHSTNRNQLSILKKKKM